MSQDHDKIIDRMKKLLAMSEGKGNEHEAMIAAKRLHAMLAKHNISMSELNSEQNPVGDEGFESRSRPWKRIVGMYVAELYFCSFYSMDSSKTKGAKRFMFVGTEANRSFAVYICNMIFKTIEREGHAQCRQYTGKTTGPFYNSFLTGACERISDRCKELIASAKSGTLEDEEGNTLPVLLSVYDQNKLIVNDWISDNLKLKIKNCTTKITNRAGHAAGTEAGNKVQLSRAIQKKNTPKRLGVGL